MSNVASPNDLERLLRVAKNQRALMFCILAQIAILVAAFAVRLPIVWGLLMLVVGIASLVFTMKLARMLFGTPATVVCALLLVGPNVAVWVVPETGALLQLVALITLLVVNQRATKTLTNAGFKVGLMGGNPADIEAQMRPR